MSFASFLSGPGDASYKVPLELFAENRKKLAKKIRSHHFDGFGNFDSNRNHKYIVVLKGGPSPTRYDTDHEPVFRQESYFWWMTGVKEPDCALAFVVDCCDSDQSNDEEYQYALFVPRLPASYATIMGKIRTLDEWRDIYGVGGGAHYVDTLTDFCQSQMARPDKDSKSFGAEECTILLLSGRNTDSGNMYEDRVFPKLLSLNQMVYDSSSAISATMNYKILFPLISELRVTKTEYELKLMEHVTMITSFAHSYVMRNTRPGMYEYQCESLFKHYSYYNYGSRLVSYTSICGCGPNSAVLHYGHTGEPNSRLIQENDHCLFDMGAEYQCYASDVTCSFPANGKFSSKYRSIYESVLNAQRAVIAKMEPGISWQECHIAAELEIVKGLFKIGIIQLPEWEVKSGDKEFDDLITERELERLVREHRLGAVFMPHGMGHLIGIDTHDVGGYVEDGRTPERSALPGLKSLRTARKLEVNMVLTVEPGCYFIDHLLDEALAEDSPLRFYLNKDLLKDYRGYGGVRLEDVVVVTTPTPCETSVNPKGQSCVRNFTLCPRTVKEVEHVMSGGNWPPKVDEAPELRRLRLTEPWSPLPSPPSR